MGNRIFKGGKRVLNVVDWCTQTIICNASHASQDATKNRSQLPDSKMQCKSFYMLRKTETKSCVYLYFSTMPFCELSCKMREKVSLSLLYAGCQHGGQNSTQLSIQWSTRLVKMKEIGQWTPPASSNLKRTETAHPWKLYFLLRLERCWLIKSNF